MTANDIINDFERKELIEWAINQFEAMKSCSYTWEKEGDKDKCREMTALLKSLDN
jgi:hypothetical protein